jgi:hypothetical protein
MSLKRTALVLVAAVACESSPTPVSDVAAERMPLPNGLGNPYERITPERLTILDEQVQMATENLAAAQQRLVEVRAAALDASLAAGSRDMIDMPPWGTRIRKAERDVEIRQSLLRELKTRQYETEVFLAWKMYGEALRASGPPSGSADSAGER